MSGNKDSNEQFGDLEELTRQRVAPPPMYKVVLHNDDYTPMDFVIDVLSRFFNMQYEQATEVMLKVHYEGMLLDGAVFDSSFKRNQPIDFTLGVGQVIKGWDEGISLLSVGEKATFIIPSDLAYGKSGAGGVIPPNATLIFDVELMDVK